MDYKVIEFSIRRERIPRPGMGEREALAFQAHLLGFEGDQLLPIDPPPLLLVLEPVEVPEQVLTAIETITEFLEAQAPQVISQEVDRILNFRKSMKPIKKLALEGKEKRRQIQ